MSESIDPPIDREATGSRLPLLPWILRHTRRRNTRAVCFSYFRARGAAASAGIGHDAVRQAGKPWRAGGREGESGEKRFQGGLANVSCRWLAGVNAKTEITNS